ncbi:MAG: GNAT family N-acetyltransferase [Gorillibacterium sp.]|nr:GNAT family N-acetyltransferase [Gorillibacterium sp.]
MLLIRNGLFIDKGLDQAWHKQIKELEQRCNAYDGITLKMHWEMLEKRSPEEINDFLWLEDGNIVGIYSLCNFIAGESEIAAMVEPDFRRRGIMTELKKAAEAEAGKRGIKKLVYVCPERSLSGKAYLFAQKLEVTYSEYGMEWSELILQPNLEHKKERTIPPVRLRQAGSDQRDRLIALDVQGFGDSPENAASYVDLVLGNAPEDRAFIAEITEDEGHQDTFVQIGKLCINVRDGVGFIFGFSVIPAYRGLGYGRAILLLAIERLHEENLEAIKLEVQTNNRKALGLYHDCGFKETNVNDYHEQWLA